MARLDSDLLRKLVMGRGDRVTLRDLSLASAPAFALFSEEPRLRPAFSLRAGWEYNGFPGDARSSAFLPTRPLASRSFFFGGGSSSKRAAKGIPQNLRGVFFFFFFKTRSPKNAGRLFGDLRAREHGRERAARTDTRDLGFSLGV